jgi:pullulanase/glycogen debranching enzyme
VKEGILTATNEWWKHLRSTKRAFWKGETKASRQFARQEAASQAHKEIKEIKDRPWSYPLCTFCQLLARK